MEVEVYLDDKKEGIATLIERKETWSNGVLMVVQDDDQGPECDQVNVIQNSWVVEIKKDKFTNPFRTTRKVLEFHSCGELPIEEENEES